MPHSPPQSLGPSFALRDAVRFHIEACCEQLKDQAEEALGRALKA